MHVRPLVADRLSLQEDVGHALARVGSMVVHSSGSHHPVPTARPLCVVWLQVATVAPTYSFPPLVPKVVPPPPGGEKVSQDSSIGSLGGWGAAQGRVGPTQAQVCLVLSHPNKTKVVTNGTTATTSVLVP